MAPHRQGVRGTSTGKLTFRIRHWSHYARRKSQQRSGKKDSLRKYVPCCHVNALVLQLFFTRFSSSFGLSRLPFRHAESARGGE